MNTKTLHSATTLFLLAYCSIAQSQTFSPYTPAQIREFNNQPIAPAETPAGAIYPDNQKPKANPKSSLGAHYFSQPIGEEEAEAQDSDSATPFTPTPSTFTF